MKYFMIESTFHQPAPVGEDDLQRLIKEHQRYLARGFAEGWILVSGPKAAGGGGVIMMKMASLDDGRYSRVSGHRVQAPRLPAGNQGVVPLSSGVISGRLVSRALPQAQAGRIGMPTSYVAPVSLQVSERKRTASLRVSPERP